MPYDLHTIKWSIRQYYSRKPYRILRIWSNPSTIPSPRAVRFAQPPPLQAQRQAGCSGEWDPLRVSGSLVNDRGRIRKLVVERQVSSSTDWVESPVKEKPSATPSVQVAETNANLPARNNCVRTPLIPWFSPTLAALTFIEIFFCTQWFSFL